MVDLHAQYVRIKGEIDEAIQQVLVNGDFIQGADVKKFESSLGAFLGGKTHVISCANGTDALQIAMMALGFQPGDEIIVPVHTYVATAEAIALLRLVPVFVDVTEDYFTIDISAIEKVITKKTVAIVPVHLYGQCADMRSLLQIARQHGLAVIEDAAQSLGADFIEDNQRKKAGTIGDIGTTSFFPSKNLGAYGDGGALFTHRADLAERLRMIATHGQKKKYHHEIVGVNSRLDTMQAAILSVKLKYLDHYAGKRAEVASYYDAHILNTNIVLPARAPYSTHVFHQYTIKVLKDRRDAMRDHLDQKGVPTMIYYPVPLHLQNAYRREGFGPGSFPVTERLSSSVLSLPIHTEMDQDQLSYICDCINDFQ